MNAFPFVKNFSASSCAQHIYMKWCSERKVCKIENFSFICIPTDHFTRKVVVPVKYEKCIREHTLAAIPFYAQYPTKAENYPKSKLSPSKANPHMNDSIL